MGAKRPESLWLDENKQTDRQAKFICRYLILLPLKEPTVIPEICPGKLFSHDCVTFLQVFMVFTFISQNSRISDNNKA